MKAIIQRVLRSSVSGMLYYSNIFTFKDINQNSSELLDRWPILGRSFLAAGCCKSGEVKREKIMEKFIVDEQLVSSIGRGYLILVGIHQDDTERDIEYLVRKILNVRLFEDDTRKRWMKNVVDKKYEILCVSQFTLYYNLKGNKPEFRHSMKAEQSKDFYDLFLKKLRGSYNADFVRDGVFGAMMTVNITNDGPVTIELESPKVSLSDNIENTDV